VRYEILGPLRVVDEKCSSFLSARKIEVLLAVLLIRADQVVPLGQLFSEIWDDNAPRRATAGVHVYVSQLRKFLSRPDRADSPIVTRPSGYQLQLGSDELDLHSFIRLAKLGREHARNARNDHAAACFEQALALWKGPALGDLPRGPIIDGFVAWLMEERLDCVELMVESHMSLGRHREQIGRLYSLTVEHPLREPFYRQLMLALYRSERQADALKVYQSARRTLNRELGLEPCRPLQNLHRAILVADSRLDLCAAALGPGGAIPAPAAA
jgi:DNA-binding SARP family transcriptional activator